MFITENLQSAAQALGCTVAAIRAIAQEEAGGIGFYEGTDKAVAKFEGHLFHHHSNGVFCKSHPALSYPSKTERHTQYGPVGAYNRLNQAMKLDADAAVMATGWGAFQILGEEYEACGFKHLMSFTIAMHTDINDHLAAFVAYVKYHGLQHYLINMAQPGQALIQANGFAGRYNPHGYRAKDYDVNVANYFTKFNKQNLS